METRANTTLIGAFTLAVLTVFGLFLWWFLRAGESSNRESYRIVFSGPVGGLRTGANVFYNGIRKGEVRHLEIDPADPRRVIALVAVQQGTPVSTATRAALNVQILSGIASVSLTNGPGPTEPLPRVAGGPPPQIGPVVPGGQDLLAGAQETMNTLNGLVRRLDDVLTTGQGSFQRSLENVEKFTAALGDNSGNVRDFLNQTGEAARQIGALAQRLDRVTTQVESMMEGSQPGRITSILRNVDELTAGLNAQRESFADLLRDARQAANSLTRTLGSVSDTVTALDVQRFNRAVANAEQVTGQLQSMMEGATPGRITSILRNIDELSTGLNAQNQNFADLLREARQAAGSLTRTLGSVNETVTTFDVRALNRTIANADRVVTALDSERISRSMANIDRFTQALGDNSASVDQLLRNAGEVAAKLNTMADRIDNLLKSFSGDGQNNMFAEFTQTARSVRTLAERLDTRTAQLTNSITGFTDRTIRDIQSLSADGRRTLTELERTLRSLERNPQRFIFGGSGVPEFNRR